MQRWSIHGKESGPSVLLLAGVHGDEYEPMIALTELAHELLGAIRRGSVQIDPLVNADAYLARSRFGRDGLDLARVCPGLADGSATEQAAFDVSERIRKADIVVDLHTGGVSFDIYPLVGYILHPDLSIREQQRQLASATGMPLIWGTDHRPEGRTLSVARDAGVPAIYLEYGGGSGFRRQVVEQYKLAVRRILVELRMLKDERLGRAAWKYWLEDDRPDSGYLQGKMPAPNAGIFVPEVKVGDWVSAGDRFGDIVDPYSGNIQPVLTEESGLVFLLQLSAAVQKGDALGGIMNVTVNRQLIISDGEGSNN